MSYDQIYDAFKKRKDGELLNTEEVRQLPVEAQFKALKSPKFTFLSLTPCHATDLKQNPHMSRAST